MNFNARNWCKWGCYCWTYVELLHASTTCPYFTTCHSLPSFSVLSSIFRVSSKLKYYIHFAFHTLKSVEMLYSFLSGGMYLYVLFKALLFCMLYFTSQTLHLYPNYSIFQPNQHICLLFSKKSYKIVQVCVFYKTQFSQNRVLFLFTLDISIIMSWWMM